MNTKRMLCAALAVTTAASLMLSGCERKEAGKSAVTTVSIWTGDGGSKAVMTELVNEFNNSVGKEKGIKIEYEVKEGDIKEQIELALTTDQAPDLFIADQTQKYAESGYIAALEDLPGGKELIERYDPSELREYSHTYKGKTYYLPFSRNLYGLIYNKDMFKAAGIVDEKGNAKPPETYAELRETAKKLTDVYKKQFGIIFPLKWGSWLNQEVVSSLMSSYGRNYYIPNEGKYDFSIMKEPLETIMGIKKDGSCYPGAENIDNDVARARFAEGNIGMKYGVSWDVGVLNDQFPAKCDWGVAPLPTADKEHKYMQHSSVGIGPYINAKSVKTKDADKIMEVYKWYHSDELAKELYEKGAYIPWDYSIIKGVKLKNAKKGWKEFAALGDISVTSPIMLRCDLSGKTDIGVMFLNDVWSQKSSVDSFISKATANYTDGAKKYKELNPDYDTSIAITEKWNTER